jgi:hypothetical protein
MADEVVRGWDLTEIRLEARYVSHKPDAATLNCRSISLVPPKFHVAHGADGSVQRSMVEPAAILAIGVDAAAISALAWSPTHLLFNESSTNERLEFPVSLRDLDVNEQSARFVVRG